MAFVHSEDIIHSDVKSVSPKQYIMPSCRSTYVFMHFQDNILVGPMGQPLLMDFGVSQFCKSEPGTDEELHAQGTVRWMASELLKIRGPEHTSGARCTKLSDVWSYGMTLYVSWQ